MAGPAYRGLRLDGPLAEFHRALDRLRWDTIPGRTEPMAATPAPAPRPSAEAERATQPALGLPT